MLVCWLLWRPREFDATIHQDYETAFYVLNTLKYEKPFALPAKDSEKSGILFSRMMNLENLSFLQDETLPL